MPTFNSAAKATHLMLSSHLVELIHTADPTVRQHHRPRLKHKVARHGVPHDADRQAGVGAGVAAHVQATGRGGRCSLLGRDDDVAVISTHGRNDGVAEVSNQSRQRC